MAKTILFEIEVQNVGAARRIESLREEIRRLNKEIKGAEVGSPVYNELINKLTDAKQETAKLKDEQKALNREFQAARVPKDSLAGLRIEYAKLTEQIKVLSAAQRSSPFGQDLIANAARVKKEIDGIEQSIGRFTGNVGNYRSAFQGLNSVLLQLGAGFGVSEIIQQNTRLSDSIANVAKTTGLTIQQAEKLAETLSFRDTRTSLADQLQIAEIGGQLGIANEQIEQFTAGVDVLNVALGDQFGNVETLTREFAGLRNVLTDFRTEDAADDILKLGNAVNFLEAEGNATGQSIVEFAGRIAGAGVPLGATTAQIIGLSTTLSELAINPERGATAVSRLLAELARAPEVFAQAIGEPADRFTNLVQTDIVGALALVSERIATSSETNTVFARTLDELGIGAQGAIEVFGKLGGSTDLLRNRIAQAGVTLQNTDSITREFEVKNNNAAAAVEKLKNAIIAAFTSDTAQDAIAEIAGALTDLVGGLGEAAEFLRENELLTIELAAALIYLNRQGIIQAIPLLKNLALATGAFTIAENGAITATRGATAATIIDTTAKNAAAVATRALTVAMSALPFLAIIAGVYALVQAFEAYEDSASASEKAARAVAAAQGEIAKESAKETEAVRRNIEVLKFDTQNKEARKKAIEELKAAYPDYLRGLDLEKASIQELDRLQNQLTESIIRSVAERRKAAAQEEVAQKIIEQTLEVQRLERLAPPTAQQAQETVGSFAGASAIGQTAAETAARSQIAALNNARAELQKLKAELEETGRAFDDAFSTGTGEREISSAERDFLQFNAELAAQFPGLSQEAETAATETEKLGAASEGTGKKIQGLGDKSKGAKQEIEAQAGSIAALKREISDLEKQIEATAPDSPRFAALVRQLDELQAKLKQAERAFASAQFRARGGRIGAPEIEEAAQPELDFETGLKPGSDEKLASEAEAARAAAEAQLKSIGFDVSIKPPTEEEINRAQILFDIQREEGKRLAEEQRAQEEQRQELRELGLQSSLEAAQTIAGSLFEIQANRLQQETQAAIDALDIETQARIAAAKGDETKIAAIEKDALKKREAIEKEAARQRKAIAVKEAIVNTALAITRALTGAPPPANLILAGVAAAAGAAQLAVINSQEFWEGGTVKRLQSGKVREKQNAPRTPHGDTVLAYLAPGEMVLNEGQQDTIRSLFGKDAFALAGVPGESATITRPVPAFASGGVVGVVPQNGFAQNVSQPVAVKVETEFTQAQMEQIGATLGTILAPVLGNAVREGTILGGDESNRLAEREARAAQNRAG